MSWLLTTDPPLNLEIEIPPISLVGEKILESMIDGIILSVKEQWIVLYDLVGDELGTHLFYTGSPDEVDFIIHVTYNK